MQEFKLLKVFEENSVAVAPLTNMFDYTESSNANKGNSAPFGDITNLKKAMIDEVAKILGIPPSLIHGDMADKWSHTLSFVLNLYLRRLRTN